MFDFFSMIGNYEERKLKNDVVNGATIDTAAVTDSAQPYETGIEHPLYNDGGWVIVELYDDKDAALKGHEKWVKLFSQKKLPASLTDVSTATISKLKDAFVPPEEKDWRKMKKASK